MSKYYLVDFNRVLADVREALKDNLVESIEEADKVIVWQDVMGVGMGVVKAAKMQKKPVILMQHGRWGTGRYYRPFYQKCLSDQICVWGQEVKDRMVDLFGQEAEVYGILPLEWSVAKEVLDSL